jgi:hypothetical protein
MEYIERRHNPLRRAAERYGRHVQFAIRPEFSDDAPRVLAAILGASLAGLLMWAAAIGAGHLMFS